MANDRIMFDDGTSDVAVVAAAKPLPVYLSATGPNSDGATLTKVAVTMSGASGVLLAASAARTLVLVSNPASNAAAAIDITGGTASLTAGIPLAAGQTLEVTGKAAQSAMTQIGTNLQVLTVYTGA